MLSFFRSFRVLLFGSPKSTNSKPPPGRQLLSDEQLDSMRQKVLEMHRQTYATDDRS